MSIDRLKAQIQEKLSPLIDADYIFLEIPFYPNPGDVAIWKGTIDFLKTLPYKCLYTSSLVNYKEPKIDSNVIILLQGGGNFGDLYPLNQAFRNKIIRSFPNNRIIILPQTVYYCGARAIREDVRLLSNHPKLTICARDSKSFRFLKRFRFSRDIRLVPDMAFYIDRNDLLSNASPSIGKALWVDRTDREKGHSFTPKETDYDREDWKILVENSLITKKWEDYISHINKEEFGNFTIFLQNVYFPHLLQSASQQLSSHSTIYTSRLHAAILSFVIGKEAYLIDNSYGKNSSFYSTWWKKESQITLIDTNHHFSANRICRILLATVWCRYDMITKKIPDLHVI